MVRQPTGDPLYGWLVVLISYGSILNNHTSREFCEPAKQVGVGVNSDLSEAASYTYVSQIYFAVLRSLSDFSRVRSDELLIRGVVRIQLSKWQHVGGRKSSVNCGHVTTTHACNDSWTTKLRGNIHVLFKYCCH